ncbi:MAG: oligosaccharide flippase family protein [Candidatus Rokuibacteriota bacterium]
MSAPARLDTRVARNAVLKAAVQATRILSLAFLVLAARVLGPEDFGRFTFAYALATLLGAALDLGMHSLLVRGVARAREETARQWAAAATLKLRLLIPAGVVFALLPVVTQRPLDTTVAVWLLGAAIALQSFIELAVSVFTGFERLELELGLRLVEKLCLVAIGITGLGLGGGLWLVSGAFTLAGGVSLVLGVLLVDRRLTPLAWRWDPAGARALTKALGPVAAAFLLAFATTRLVPLLVALLGGDVAAGYFGAAIRVLDVVMIVPVALGAAVYPVLARTAPRDPRFRRMVARAVEMLLILGLPVALGLGHGAEWLTASVYGERYGPTAPLLRVLGAAACLGFLNYFLGFVFLAVDRPGRLLAVTAVSLVASAGLTPGLVLAAGAAGGAAALVLVETITLAASLMGLLPIVGLPFGRGALKAGAAATAAGLVAVALPAGRWRLGVALLVYAGGVVALNPVPADHWSSLLRAVLRPAPED